MKMKALVICVCLPLVCGCSDTDILTVFQDRLLSETAMGSFLGNYTLSQNAMELSRGALTMERRGARYFVLFEFTGSDGQRGKYEGFFLLSHIPKTTSFNVGDTKLTFTSNRQTILFSAPTLTLRANGEEQTLDNLVLIMRQDGNKLYFWCLVPGTDVAKGRLKEHSGDGTFKSDDVKAFLAEYADAYVLANEPAFVFTNR